MDLIKGLVGLIEMACMRSDMPKEIRQAIAINHRYVDAVDFLSQECQPKGDEGVAGATHPPAPYAASPVFQQEKP